MNCVENFALGDCLATANDSAVSGILLNKLLAFLVAHVSEANRSFALGNKIGFFLRTDCLCNCLSDIFGNSRGGGETRRFNACNVKETVILFARLNDKIIIDTVRSEACKEVMTVLVETVGTDF